MTEPLTPLERELCEALEALLNAFDSCVELTPAVIGKASSALTKAKDRTNG